MRLSEISKDEFRAKLYNPMIEEVRDSVNLFIELIADKEWDVSVEEEYEDDFVVWTITARKEEGNRRRDQILWDYSLILGKYDENGVTGDVIDTSVGYLKFRIQLDLISTK